MNRAELCRRLLGTAMQLFLDSKDPVSVHTLAASALEHAEFLASKLSDQNFKSHVFSTFPDLNEKSLKRLRNKYWRVIKHSHDLKKQPFDVEAQLVDFDDGSNDAILFCGWYDFMKCGKPIPVEVQLFQLWFFRVYPDSLDPKKDFEFAPFEDLDKKPRFIQKQILSEQIQIFKTRVDIRENPMTDNRPLVLP